MSGDFSYTGVIPTLQVKAEDSCVSFTAFKSKMGGLENTLISRLSSPYLDFHNFSLTTVTSLTLRRGMPP